MEQRAVACFTLARCIIAAGDSTGRSHLFSIYTITRPILCAIADTLREALPYVLIAESDFCQLEMYQPAKDAQYLLSVLYHNLDMKDERQNAAQRHSDTELKQQELEMTVIDKEVLRVFELIATVGDALASR